MSTPSDSLSVGSSASSSVRLKPGSTTTKIAQFKEMRARLQGSQSVVPSSTSTPSARPSTAPGSGVRTPTRSTASSPGRSPVGSQPNSPRSVIGKSTASGDSRPVSAGIASRPKPSTTEPVSESVPVVTQPSAEKPSLKASSGLSKARASLETAALKSVKLEDKAHVVTAPVSEATVQVSHGIGGNTGLAAAGAFVDHDIQRKKFAKLRGKGISSTPPRSGRLAGLGLPDLEPKKERELIEAEAVEKARREDERQVMTIKEESGPSLTELTLQEATARREKEKRDRVTREKEMRVKETTDRLERERQIEIEDTDRTTAVHLRPEAALFIKKQFSIADTSKRGSFLTRREIMTHLQLDDSIQKQLLVAYPADPITGTPCGEPRAYKMFLQILADNAAGDMITLEIFSSAFVQASRVAADERKERSSRLAALRKKENVKKSHTLPSGSAISSPLKDLEIEQQVMSHHSKSSISGQPIEYPSPGDRSVDRPKPTRNMPPQTLQMLDLFWSRVDDDNDGLCTRTALIKAISKDFVIQCLITPLSPEEYGGFGSRECQSAIDSALKKIQSTAPRVISWIVLMGILPERVYSQIQDFDCEDTESVERYRYRMSKGLLNWPPLRGVEAPPPSAFTARQEVANNEIRERLRNAVEQTDSDDEEGPSPAKEVVRVEKNVSKQMEPKPAVAVEDQTRGKKGVPYEAPKSVSASNQRKGNKEESISNVPESKQRTAIVPLFDEPDEDINRVSKGRWEGTAPTPLRPGRDTYVASASSRSGSRTPPTSSARAHHHHHVEREPPIDPEVERARSENLRQMQSRLDAAEVNQKTLERKLLERDSEVKSLKEAAAAAALELEERRKRVAESHTTHARSAMVERRLANLVCRLRRMHWAFRSFSVWKTITYAPISKNGGKGPLTRTQLAPAAAASSPKFGASKGHAVEIDDSVAASRTDFRRHNPEWAEELFAMGVGDEFEDDIFDDLQKVSDNDYCNLELQRMINGIASVRLKELAPLCDIRELIDQLNLRGESLLQDRNLIRKHFKDVPEFVLSDAVRFMKHFYDSGSGMHAAKKGEDTETHDAENDGYVATAQLRDAELARAMRLRTDVPLRVALEEMTRQGLVRANDGPVSMNELRERSLAALGGATDNMSAEEKATLNGRLAMELIYQMQQLLRDSSDEKKELLLEIKRLRDHKDDVNRVLLESTGEKRRLAEQLAVAKSVLTKAISTCDDIDGALE